MRFLNYNGTYRQIIILPIHMCAWAIANMCVSAAINAHAWIHVYISRAHACQCHHLCASTYACLYIAIHLCSSALINMYACIFIEWAVLNLTSTSLLQSVFILQELNICHSSISNYRRHKNIVLIIH